MYRIRLLRTTMLAGSVGTAFLASPAYPADMAAKAPAQGGCIQAVDGTNGQAGAFGGFLGNQSFYGGQGSVSLPLGCEFGVQLDGIAGSLDGSSLNIGGGHVFWRNPTQGLVGVYGDYAQWDRFTGVSVGHIGPEGELYYGQWTLQGLAGAEYGSGSSAVSGPLLQSVNIPTRFFDEVNLAYYLQDNFEVYAGHRYLGGKNAAAFGAEWGIPWPNGIMAALFAEARVGEDQDHGVWGGLRFYFGNRDKTLIRRHREDDPTNWDTDAVFGATNNSGSAPAPPAPCTGDGCFD